jgi:Predicted membrane protein
MLPPTRRRLRRFHDDEDGAVLLIVVFALVAVVGMLVLVVDLGSLVSTRRAAVTAADAAALAAAQSCFDGDAAGAPVAAQQLGLANLENSGTSLSGTTSTIIAQQGCGTSREYGYVTVKVATNQDLYFAPSSASTRTASPPRLRLRGEWWSDRPCRSWRRSGARTPSPRAISPTRLRVRLATSSWTTTTMEGASSGT